MSASPAAPPPADAPAGRKGSKKLLIILAAALLLLAGGGAGLWFSGIAPRMLGLAKKPSAVSKIDPQALALAKTVQPAYADLPDIIANLNASPRHPSFVKLKAKIELAKAADQPAVAAALPRLLDLFQTYLRDMRPEELTGSAGTYRLREELVARANIALDPVRVTDVLFVELLIQ